jgi:hypothetical protein
MIKRKSEKITKLNRNPSDVHENLYQHFKVVSENKQELAKEFLNNECPFRPRINKMELTKYK